MRVVIPVPIGKKHVATVQGTVWKFVACEQCNGMFAYPMVLHARGEDHDLLFLDGKGSAEQARAQAERNFSLKSERSVLPVPCPHCGMYQAEMARRLKDDAWQNPFQFAGLGIVVLSLLFLAFDIDFAWIYVSLFASLGLACLAYGCWLSFRFDPNGGDPEPRKAIGQKSAVWGERLSELARKYAEEKRV